MSLDEKIMKKVLKIQVKVISYHAYSYVYAS